MALASMAEQLRQDHTLPRPSPFLYTSLRGVAAPMPRSLYLHAPFALLPRRSGSFGFRLASGQYSAFLFVKKTGHHADAEYSGKESHENAERSPSVN